MHFDDQTITLEPGFINQTIFFAEMIEAYQFNLSTISMPIDVFSYMQLCTNQPAKINTELQFEIDYSDSLYIFVYNQTLIIQSIEGIDVIEYNVDDKQIINSYTLKQDKKTNMAPARRYSNNMLTIDEKYGILFILNSASVFYSIYDTNTTQWLEIHKINRGFITRTNIEKILAINGLLLACSRSEGLDIYQLESLLVVTNLDLTRITFLKNLDKDIFLSFDEYYDIDIIDIYFDKQTNTTYVLDIHNGLYAVNLSFLEQAIYPVVMVKNCYKFVMRNNLVVFACQELENTKYSIQEYIYNDIHKNFSRLRVFEINEEIDMITLDDMFIYIQTTSAFLAYPHSIPTEYMINPTPIIIFNDTMNVGIMPFYQEYPNILLVNKMNSIQAYSFELKPPAIDCFNDGLFPEGNYLYLINASRRTCDTTIEQNSVYDACIMQMKFTAKIYKAIFDDEKTDIIVGLAIGLGIGLIMVMILYHKYRKNKNELKILKGKYINLKASAKNETDITVEVKKNVQIQA